MTAPTNADVLSVLRSALDDMPDEKAAPVDEAVRCVAAIIEERDALRRLKQVVEKLPMCSFCDPEDWTELDEALARGKGGA